MTIVLPNIPVFSSFLAISLTDIKASRLKCVAYALTWLSVFELYTCISFMILT